MPPKPERVADAPTVPREAVGNFSRANARKIIKEMGWPEECPRCGEDTAIGGWDVPSMQCRTCWGKDLDRDRQTAEEFNQHIRGDDHPMREWCKGTKVDGARCAKDAEFEGYCKHHWRQAVTRGEHIRAVDEGDDDARAEIPW